MDERRTRLQIESGHLVLIDPLALDGLSQQLAEIGKLPIAEQLSKLKALGNYGLRIGIQALNGAPGTYEIAPDSFEAVDEGEADAGVFDIDTGAVIVIDGSALSAVARALTWERYDRLLQAPVNDDSILRGIYREIGGRRFAIVTAEAGSLFGGDGAFRLRQEGLISVL